MSKKARKRKANTPPKNRKGGAPPVQPADYASAGPKSGTPLFILGTVLLLVCVAVSGVMVVDHISGLSLPGCGEGSPCAAAANSAWGKIPLGGKWANGQDRVWPVSFLGFAYFAGVFIAWLIGRGGVPSNLQMLIRLGALASLLFVVVMVAKRDSYFCKYCLAIHAANLAFWVMTEKARRSLPRVSSLRPLVMTTAVFAIASIGLLAADSRERANVEAVQESELQDSISKIIKGSGNGPTGQSTTVVTENPTTNTTGDDSTQPVKTADDRPWTGPFTGRWRMGPEKAAVRIVMYTDHQCTDCMRIEGEIRERFPSWEGVSLSIKHFPMDMACNSFSSQTLHAAACWAARAAETAGILGGNDAFWAMSHLLFDQKGDFTNTPIDNFLAEWGIDRSEFFTAMDDLDTLERVRSDIAEANWLGLHFTPMVFINGVELRGVFAHQGVNRAVESILATYPEPATAENDDPPPATEKCIQDWREQYKRSLPADRTRWPMGPDDARVKIVMWADFQETYTAEADGIIRKWMENHPDAQYTFRHFPFLQSCNPVVSRSAHPNACLASSAAEAAGILGGGDAYWKMHVWLMTNQKALSDATLRQAAGDMGLDPDELSRTMGLPAVASAIEEDCRAAKPTLEQKLSWLYRGGIPTIYVNGKVIPRWRRDDNPVLVGILNAAYNEQ